MKKSKNDFIGTLSGIIPPMLTPLLSDWTLDRPAVKKLIDHMIDGGVNGIFILGTTGESTSLSYRTRRELIEQTIGHVHGRVPVLVGITDTSIEESLELVSLAHDFGADAVVAAPPFYFQLGQEELFEFYWDLADRSKLPIFLYNMPSMTKISMSIDTVVRLSAHENIIGLKDSSANTVYFQSLKYSIKREDFALFVGPEEIMAETVLMGGNGGVNGGANLFPELYVRMYNAAVDHDFESIKILQRQILEISSLIYNVGKYNSSYLKGLKGTASLLDICGNYLAPPLKPFLKREMDQLANNLVKIRKNLHKTLS
ncbi:dihydrodipicolinate synthase family protein [Flagellimonas olearia]|uniref:Dihydrodipicolinate synthase family protein n=1 Tax=Flagellimonas olearia TaxID=552546 RepID=A0A6I1DZV7_9FLAO|nr:dihydrodipicolinate synthase family protein [Allomuricauda olearia]KAB7530397.1 dihydrodipicolinate synthase family protein [Allomuricauda olearia]